MLSLGQEVFIWSVLLSLLLSLLYRKFTDPKEMKKFKEDMKFYRDKVNKAAKEGNKAELDKYRPELTKLQGKQMNLMGKPMMISFILFIIAFQLLGSHYGPTVDVPINITTIQGLGEVKKGTFSFQEESYEIIFYKTNEVERLRMDLNRNGNFLDDKEVLLNSHIFNQGQYHWFSTGSDKGYFIIRPPRPDVYLLTSDVITLPFPLPLLTWETKGIPFVKWFTIINWFWLYLLVVLPFSSAFRKMLGVM